MSDSERATWQKNQEGVGGKERSLDKPERKNLSDVCDLEALRLASIRCQSTLGGNADVCAVHIDAYKECIKQQGVAKKEERDRVLRETMTELGFGMFFRSTPKEKP